VSEAFGRYRIVGELGRGAMGAVYRAIDPLIDREVAIKTLLPTLPEEIAAEFRERFLREARSAGRLNHPNIVTVFDVGEQGGVAYIAMELLEGRSLQQVLREQKRLPFAQAADVAAQVADALDHARQFSIVHRDIKPANIMVAASGRCKLTDFGVAYVPSSTMTQTGATLGSPRYMSPEQVLGLKADPRADLFSLGVVLYEMLAGATPFHKESDTTPWAVMSRIAGEPHPPVRSFDASIPEAFERILERALAKKPEQRYAAAGEMATDLRQALSAKPSVASLASTVVSQPRPAAGSPASLMDDLDAFARRLDEEEAEARRRSAEEERERARQAEEARRKAAAEAQRRPAGAPPAPGAAPATAPRRPGALDMLRQQTAAAPAAEDPAQQKRRAIEALDRALRAANRFLGDFAAQLSSVRPASGRPYAVQFMGTIPVALSEARTDARPRVIESRDYLDYALLRFNATAQPPVKLVITGDDVARLEAYLKGLKASYELQATARHDFGHVTRAIFTVKGPFPCEAMLKADYDRNEVAIELTGVRRIGKTACRVPAAEVEDAVDELGRYILGADDDFERRLSKR
jgi:serine/threonine-protein kinase